MRVRLPEPGPPAPLVRSYVAAPNLPLPTSPRYTSPHPPSRAARCSWPHCAIRPVRARRIRRRIRPHVGGTDVRRPTPAVHIRPNHHRCTAIAAHRPMRRIDNALLTPIPTQPRPRPRRTPARAIHMPSSRAAPPPIPTPTPTPTRWDTDARTHSRRPPSNAQSWRRRGRRCRNLRRPATRARCAWGSGTDVATTSRPTCSSCIRRTTVRIRRTSAIIRMSGMGTRTSMGRSCRGGGNGPSCLRRCRIMGDRPRSLMIACVLFCSRVARRSSIAPCLVFGLCISLVTRTTCPSPMHRCYLSGCYLYTVGGYPNAAKKAVKWEARKERFA